MCAIAALLCEFVFVMRAQVETLTLPCVVRGLGGDGREVEDVES